MNRKVQIIIIVVLTILAYVNIFQNQFVIDDKTFIVNWEKIRNLENIGDLLKGAVPAGHEGVYRPIRSMLYAIYYQIWVTNPFGYHLHSILVHLASTILVYLIIEAFTKKRYAPFIGGLLFGLHPVHSESITYISASMEMTGVAFFLASFYLYLMGFTHIRPASTAKRGESRFLKMMSYFFATLAFFTYEVTLTLPFLIVFYDFSFKKLNFKANALKKYSPYFLILFGYLVVRILVLGFSSRGTYLNGSLFLTILASLKVFFKYVLLTIAPVGQMHNHIIPRGIETILYRGHNLNTTLSQSFLEWEILLATLAVIILMVVCFKSFKKHPLVTFAIGWFLITLLPAANLIPQWSLMHEKFLYLPSFGLILLFIFALEKLIRAQNIYWLVVLAVSLGFLVLTMNRNNDWKDAVVLWSKDIKMSPDKNAYAYFQLGEAYVASGKKDKAIAVYLKAFEINPFFAVAAGSVARTYAELGEADLAIEFYQKALQSDPNFWEGKANLQNLLDKNQEWVNYSGLGVSFSYPKEWTVSPPAGRVGSKYQVVSIKYKGGQFVMEMEVGDKEESVEEYLSKQTQSYGKLVNQGLAQIPNFDQAYVKVFQDDQIQKMEFFLFKGSKIVKILVYPSDSSWMRQFDRIVSSLKFS